LEHIFFCQFDCGWRSEQWANLEGRLTPRKLKMNTAVRAYYKCFIKGGKKLCWIVASQQIIAGGFLKAIAEQRLAFC
jgi:hypothetical protein